jgi:hypothetical protein
MSKEQAEMHPLFPSGDWEGFYTYFMDREKHTMHFMLNFNNAMVSGAGGDDVGSFSWKGSYNKAQLDCVLIKFYSTHQVYYKGQVDENGIWGTWKLDYMSGGFHIWPKASAQNQEAAALEIIEETNTQKQPVMVPKFRIS